MVLPESQPGNNVKDVPNKVASNNSQNCTEQFDEYCQGQNLTLEDGTTGCMFGKQYTHNDKLTYLCYVCSVTCSGLLNVKMAKSVLDLLKKRPVSAISNIFPAHLNGKKHCSKLRSRKTWPKDIYEKHPSFSHTKVQLPRDQCKDKTVADPKINTFQFDLTAVCRIQPTLDALKIRKDLIGLEYMLEILPRSKDNIELKYSCVLCSMNNLVQTDAVTHFLNVNHKYKYLLLHFPTESKTYMQKEIQNCNSKIIDVMICAITEIYGYLSPVQCSLNVWNKHRNNVIKAVQIRKNFSEEQGHTFINFLTQTPTLAKESGLTVGTTVAPKAGKTGVPTITAAPPAKMTVAPKARITAATAAAPTAQMTGAPISEELLKSQLDFSAACLIQQLLNNFKKCALLGLEYLVEILRDSYVTTCEYYCVLCSWTLTKDKVIDHFLHKSHKFAYLSLHFPTLFSAFFKTDSNQKTMKALYKVTKAIEARYGRKLPVRCSQYQWLKYNATILEAVKKREHFSEKMDETFMNTLDLPLASINDESCTTSNNKTNAEAGKQSNKQQSVEAKHKRTYELERKFADEYLQKLTLPLDDGTRGPVSQMWIDRDKKQVLYLCYPCRFSLQSERVAKNHFNGNKHKLKLFSQKFWSKRIYEYSLFKDLKPGYERYEPSQGGVVQTAGTLLATKPKLTAVIDLTDDVLTTDCVIEPKLGCNNVQGPPQVELSASQPDSNDNKEEKSKFDEFIKGLTLVLEDGTRGRVLKPCTRSQDKKDVYLCYPCGVTLLGLETAKNHFKADCHRIQLKSQMTWSKDIYDNHPFDAELNKKEASLVSAVPPDEFVDLTAACVIQPVLDDCNSAAICKSAKKREHFSEKPDLTIIEVLDRSLPSVDIYNSITGEGKGDGNTNDQAQVENKTNPSQVVSAASHPTDDDNKQEESNFAEFLKELTLLLEDGTRGRVFEQRTRSQNKKDIYLCYPCRATLLSPQITKEHLKGKQHQLKLISQNTWSKDIYDNHPFDAKIKKKEASLLSAVPPDEFVDFTAACVIQPVLDDCNSNSLIGLEYLVEIVPIGLPPNYYCVLCPASINKDCVVKHLIGQAHTLRYLSLHFQTVSSAFKQLKISSVEAAKVLDNVTCAIEKKYGRMLPLTCTQLQWHKHNAAICDTVKKRWHFCETPDLTFFEVLPAGENVSSTAGVSGTKEVTKRQNKKDIPTQVVTASGQPVKVDSNKQVVQAKSMCSVLTQQVQPHTVDGKPFIAAQMSVRERKKDTRMTIDQTQCSQIEQKWLDNAIKRLDFYKKYPKSHPQYAREWQKYWYQRYKEVKAENKDPTTYDFKTEWTPYWENRMVQLHEEEIKKKEKAIEEELHLQTYYEKFSARNTPKRKSLNKERSPPHKRVARSRSPRRRPLSAGRRTRSPVRRRRSRSPVQRRRSRSPVHRRRSRSPVQRRRSRSPVQRRRSPLPFCTSPRRLSEDRLSPRRRSRAVLRSPNTKERRHSKSREDLHRSKSREKLWSSNAQYDTKQSRAPNEYHRSRSRSPIAAIRSKSKGSQDRLASRHRSPTRTSLPDLHYKQNTSQPGELNNLTATIMSPLGRTSNKESKKQVNQKKNTIYENTQDDLDNDIMELAYYSKNPEKHPQYNDEWQRFWTRRHKEIKAQNKDPLKHDFEQEWMVFWSEVIVELHEEKIKQKQIIIQKQLDFSLDNSTTFELSTDVTSNTEIYPSRKQKTRSRTPRRRSPSIVWPSCSPLPKHSSSNRRKWTTRSRSRESSRESNNTKKTHHSKSREDVDGKEVTAPMPSGESSWSIKSMRCSRDEAALEGCSPWDESPQEVLSVLPVLRRLVALEDYLGASHASKMLDLFEQALTMEKVKPNSSQDIIEVDSHVMLLEMVKEKLTGKVEMGLVGSATHAVQEVISRTSALLQLAQLRKQRRKNEVETMQFVPGKTDVTTQEMATLVTAAVPRRRAGDKRPPTTTTNYLKKKRRSGADSQTEMSPLKILEDAYEITNKPESRHSEKSSSSEIDAMDGLSDSELKTLMQSFNHLFSDEQDRLVAYVKKLEVQNPKRVKKLRQFLKDDMFAVTCPAPANTAASQTKISANTQVSQQPSVSSDSDDDYLNCLEKVIKVKTEVIQQNEIEKVQQKSQQSRQEQEPPPRATSPPQADVSILFDMVQNISRRSLSFTQGKTASDTCKTDTWSAGGTKLGTDSWLPQTTSVQKNDITEMTVSSGWTQILQTGWDAAQPGQSSVYGDIQHYNVQTNECYQYSNQYPYYYQRQQSTSGLQWNHGSHQNQNWQTQQHGQYPQNRDLSNGGNSYLQDYYLQSENSSQQN